MKNNLITALLSVFALCFIVNAQNKSVGSKKQIQTTVKCVSNKLTFPCLDNFDVKNGGKSKNVFTAYNQKTKVGIFVFSPLRDLSEKELIDETLKGALQTLYSTNYSDYALKSSNDYSEGDKWSVHEVSKFAEVAFNKKYDHAIHIQLVRLSYKQKDIICGFSYELSKGTDSQQRFEKWRGGGSGNASDALQELVMKITGETKNDTTPGGPPPPAK